MGCIIRGRYERGGMGNKPGTRDARRDAAWGVDRLLAGGVGPAALVRIPRDVGAPQPLRARLLARLQALRCRARRRRPIGAWTENVEWTINRAAAASGGPSCVTPNERRARGHAVAACESQLRVHARRRHEAWRGERRCLSDAATGRQAGPGRPRRSPNAHTTCSRVAPAPRSGRWLRL